MGFLDQLKGVLGQSARGAGSSTQRADLDVENAARSSPQTLAEGVMEAFQSGQTPPLGQLASQIFSNANPQQKSGLLNTILGALGPSALSQIGSQQGGLGGILDAFRAGNVPPEQAERVSPDDVGRLADEAQKQNPSVVDQVSQFLSKNPSLLKTLGTATLGVVMSRFGGKR